MFNFNKNNNANTDYKVKECFLQLEGYADDLLLIDETNQMRRTMLVDTSGGENDEVIDMTIMSTNPAGKFPRFNRLRGKLIRMTVEILDD